MRAFFRAIWIRRWHADPACRQTKNFFLYPNAKRSCEIMNMGRCFAGLLIKFCTGFNNFNYHSWNKSEIDTYLCRLCLEHEEESWHLALECLAILNLRQEFFGTAGLLWLSLWAAWCTLTSFALMWSTGWWRLGQRRMTHTTFSRRPCGPHMFPLDTIRANSVTHMFPLDTEGAELVKWYLSIWQWEGKLSHSYVSIRHWESKLSRVVCFHHTLRGQTKLWHKPR